MSTKQKSRHKWSEGTCVYMFTPILTSHFYYTPKSLRWNLTVFIHVHSYTTNLTLLTTLQIVYDGISQCTFQIMMASHSVHTCISHTNLALLITLQIPHDNTSDSHVVILTHIYTTSCYSVIS